MTAPTIVALTVDIGGTKAEAGEPTALEAIDRSARALGDAEASLAAVLDFGRVAIAGRLSRVTLHYVDRVRARLAHQPLAFTGHLRRRTTPPW